MLQKLCPVQFRMVWLPAELSVLWDIIHLHWIITTCGTTALHLK